MVAEYKLPVVVVSQFDFAKQLSVAAPFVAHSKVAVVAPSMALAAGLFEVPAAVVSECSVAMFRAILTSPAVASEL